MFVHLKILRSLPQKEISVSSIPCDTLSPRFSKKITHQLKCNFDDGTKILFSNVCNIGHVLSVQFIIYSNLLC
jgi:predicted ATP-grasp superfamily ATP-dependent carboligase